MISSTLLYGQREGGARFPITIEIGAPYPTEGDGGDWACPVSLKPFAGIPEVYGVDSLQALCLALNLAYALLSNFKEKGGTLTFEDGEDCPIDAFFGRSLPGKADRLETKKPK